MEQRKEELEFNEFCDELKKYYKIIAKELINGYDIKIYLNKDGLLKVQKFKPVKISP